MLRFDHGFLKNEFKRLGLSYKTKVLCTVKLTKKVLPQLSSHRLDNLIRLYGLTVENRHRAMDDADVLVQLMSKLTKEFGLTNIQDLINQQLKLASLPPNIEKQFIDSIPNEPGVYNFYDENNTLLYIGKSTCLKNRIKSHFTNDHTSSKELELTQQIKKIDFQLTGGDLGAQLLESLTIKLKQPLYNRQLRKTKKLWYFLIDANKEGYLSIQIKNDNNLPEKHLENIYGVFRSKSMALQKLKEIASSNNLCHRLTGIENKKSGACFAYQLKKCSGACVGKESVKDYNNRLLETFSIWRFNVWPYEQAIVISESSRSTTQYHLINQWCYLGSAETLYDLTHVNQTLNFDYDTYKILSKFIFKDNVSITPFKLT